MKIVISDYPDVLGRELEKEIAFVREDIPDAAVVVHPYVDPEDFYREMADADGLLTAFIPLDRAALDRMPQLKAVSINATGYNFVDLEETRRRSIPVCAIGEYCTQEVADHTMALLLASMSRVSEYDARVKQGAWSASPDFCFYAGPMEEVAGKTLGIVGFGHIGLAVARAALGLDMRVIVHTRTPKTGFEQVKFVTMDELLASSDVITLHCPLTEKTQGLIGSEAIARMKDGVRVINTARGPLVNEGAMAEALLCGKVACYMADVLSAEPPSPDNPLLSAPNTILTPHVAWAPRQTRTRLLEIAVGNVRAFLDGAPRNVVSV